MLPACSEGDLRSLINAVRPAASPAIPLGRVRRWLTTRPEMLVLDLRRLCAATAGADASRETSAAANDIARPRNQRRPRIDGSFHRQIVDIHGQQGAGRSDATSDRAAPDIVDSQDDGLEPSRRPDATTRSEPSSDQSRRPIRARLETDSRTTAPVAADSAAFNAKPTCPHARSTRGRTHTAWFGRCVIRARGDAGRGRSQLGVSA